jgi:tetratricopeptide (TPR) repeat protein
MKKVLPVLFLLAPFFAVAQNKINSSSEIVGVYHEINTFLDSGEVRKAEKAFDKIVRFYQHSHNNEAMPEQYFGMALALALSGYYPKSISYHKKAIREHKRFRESEPYEITINLGLTYHLAGKTRKAKMILGESYSLVRAENP